MPFTEIDVSIIKIRNAHSCWPYDETMLKILRETNCVTVLTYDEDEQLRRSGLVRDMPSNWKLFRDSPFCRYSECNIEVPTIRIPVYGSLAR